MKDGVVDDSAAKDAACDVDDDDSRNKEAPIVVPKAEDQTAVASSSSRIRTAQSSFLFVRGQDIESTFFASSNNNNNADNPNPEQQQEKQLPYYLVKDQLVWVCKSKGLKKRNRGKKKTGSKEEQPQPQPQQQRLEAFLRARIVHGDNEVHEQQLHMREENDMNNKTGQRQIESDNHCRDDKNEEEDDRLLVRYPKGSTYKVKRDHLWPVLEENVISGWRRRYTDNNISNNVVLVFSETDFYRRACMVHTLPDSDIFWEIGCDYGVTVDKVASTLNITNNGDADADDSTSNALASRVLGIDKSQESIDEARQRFPHLPFCVWDILVDCDKISTHNNSAANSHHEHTATTTCTSTSTIPFASLEHAIQDAVEATAITTTAGDDNAGHTAQSTTSSPTPSSSPPPPDPTTTTGRSSCTEYHHQHQQHIAVVSPPTVVAIDINGNRELPAVLACIEKVASLWKPRLIMVKSRALHCQLSLPQGEVQDAVLASMMAT